MNAKRYRCGILATCCVPWNEGCAFAEEIFRRQVRRLTAHGIRDLYIFGTAGEDVFEQFKKLLFEAYPRWAPHRS